MSEALYALPVWTGELGLEQAPGTTDYWLLLSSDVLTATPRRWLPVRRRAGTGSELVTPRRDWTDRAGSGPDWDQTDMPGDAQQGTYRVGRVTCFGAPWVD